MCPLAMSQVLSPENTPTPVNPYRSAPPEFLGKIYVFWQNLL